MSNPTLVFALHFSYWDDPPGSDGANVIAKPTLEAFANAELAASSREGLSIVEGDLWFFAADGSPLEAVFSREPYVDTERLKYFAGTYTLRAGRGQTLLDLIAERCPPIPQIIVMNKLSDAAAREHGWPSVDEMKIGVEKALKAAIPCPANSVEFEWVAF